MNHKKSPTFGSCDDGTRFVGNPYGWGELRTVQHLRRRVFPERPSTELHTLNDETG